uniref:Uncharacterized protein n=1 Tax=Parascaris univalens TaxID=6257 RepID=A0A915ADC5_PARUN
MAILAPPRIEHVSSTIIQKCHMFCLMLQLAYMKVRMRAPDLCTALSGLTWKFVGHLGALFILQTLISAEPVG